MEFLFLIPLLIWFFVIKLVYKSTFFWHFVISNFCIAISGFYIITQTKIIDVGYDIYGLGTLFAVVLFGILQPIFALLFGVFIKMYQNK